MKRHAILERLKTQEPFDLLIIGGGATGCGIAVDAASRGLKVALVEKSDIAEDTSSKSTKLVHGGVRYLEAAVKKLDRAQYHLVKEALFERGIFLQNAPHLANALPLVTPLYNWLEVPYVYAGLVMYDLLAGKRGGDDGVDRVGVQIEPAQGVALRRDLQHRQAAERVELHVSPAGNRA